MEPKRLLERSRYKKSEIQADVSTSLRSTPTDVVNDPVSVPLLNMAAFYGQVMFFHSERRQTGA